MGEDRGLLEGLLGRHQPGEKEFDANSISIPYPQQDVHLHRIEP